MTAYTMTLTRSQVDRLLSALGMAADAEDARSKRDRADEFDRLASWLRDRCWSPEPAVEAEPADLPAYEPNPDGDPIVTARNLALYDRGGAE